MLFCLYRVVIPAQADVQGEFRAHVEIVLNEQANRGVDGHRGTRDANVGIVNISQQEACEGIAGVLGQTGQSGLVGTKCKVTGVRLPDVVQFVLAKFSTEL